MNRISIPKHEWDDRLFQLLPSFDVYAPVENGFCCDYELMDTDTLQDAVYNKPKPVTPLKKFFLPVKENVTSGKSLEKPVIILGAPNCDVMALAYLDEIYLDKEYTDPTYFERRNSTIIVASDCLSIQDHCHCTSYGIDPIGNSHSDLSIAVVEKTVILSTHSEKGEKFLEKLGVVVTIEPEPSQISDLVEIQKKVVDQLKKQNAGLPGYQDTGKLVPNTSEEIWRKYASKCVSCGACSAICPTCSCFLLIDKPGFEKIRQLDTCQYPGFERVAGGEDALAVLEDRFRNRYMCKYAWKPEKYTLKACTGCGRCIESCIGQINKNELFVELSNV